MNNTIHFNFKGKEYAAVVSKEANGEIEVKVSDQYLAENFGPCFKYYLAGKNVDFRPLNLNHSALYELQGEIKKALEHAGNPDA